MSGQPEYLVVKIHSQVEIHTFNNSPTPETNSSLTVAPNPCNFSSLKKWLHKQKLYFLWLNIFLGLILRRQCTYRNVIQNITFKWPKYIQYRVTGHRGMHIYWMTSKDRYSDSHRAGSGSLCVRTCSFWMAEQTVAGGWSGACTLYPHPHHHSALAYNARNDIKR